MRPPGIMGSRGTGEEGNRRTVEDKQIFLQFWPQPSEKSDNPLPAISMLLLWVFEIISVNIGLGEGGLVLVCLVVLLGAVVGYFLRGNVQGFLRG